MAFGSSLTLAMHVGLSDTVELSLAPTTTTTKRNLLIIYAHGILMLLAWSFFGVIAAFVARNRFFFKDDKQSLWFILHRGFGMIGVLCGLTGFALTVYYTTYYHDKQFNVLHKILGLVVTIAGFQQPINGLLRPSLPESATDSKRVVRIAWELYHKFMGGVVCVILGMANVFLGLMLLKVDQKVMYAHAAWVGLVILVFSAAELQKCTDSKGDEDDTKPLSVDGPEPTNQTELATVGVPTSPKPGIKFVDTDDAPTTKSIQK